MSRVEQNHRRLPCKGTVIWFLLHAHMHLQCFHTFYNHCESLILNPTQAAFCKIIRTICWGKCTIAHVLEFKRSVVFLAHCSGPAAVLLAPLPLTLTRLSAVWMNDVCLVLNSVTSFLRFIWQLPVSCFICWLSPLWLWGLGLLQGWHACASALCIK